VVDLTDVSFMDCSALRILLALSERCAESGARFLLSGPTAIVSRLLNALQLDQVFVITGTAAEAVALAETWTELGELPPELVPAATRPTAFQRLQSSFTRRAGRCRQVSNKPQVAPATWQPDHAASRPATRLSPLVSSDRHGRQRPAEPSV
jgi:hypothetical protein